MSSSGVVPGAHICVHRRRVCVPRHWGPSHRWGADIPSGGELESLRGPHDGVIVTRALYAGERLPGGARRRRER